MPDVGPLLPIPTITVTDAGGTFNGSAFVATGTVAGTDGVAGSTLEGEGLIFDYQQQNSSGSLIADLGSTAPASAGIFQVTASFAGSADYSSASASTTFSIGQATPTLTVTDAGGTYNGQAFSAVVQIAGVVAGVDDTPSASLEGVTPTEDYQQVDSSGDVLADLGSTAPTSAGTYQVIASFAGSTDYASATNQTTFTISQATASINVAPYTVTYDGFSQTATGSATGVNGEDLSSLLDLSGTTHTDAGTYTDTWTFAGNQDYASSSGSVTDQINQATASINVMPYTVTYDGFSQTATGSATGVNGEDLTSLLDLSGTTHTDAGTYTDTWTFAGNQDYDSSSGSVTDQSTGRRHLDLCRQPGLRLQRRCDRPDQPGHPERERQRCRRHLQRPTVRGHGPGRRGRRRGGRHPVGHSGRSHAHRGLSASGLLGGCAGGPGEHGADLSWNLPGNRLVRR